MQGLMFKGLEDFEKKLCSHMGTLPGYANKSLLKKMHFFNNAFFEMFFSKLLQVKK